MAKPSKPKFQAIDQAEIDRVMAPIRAAAASLAARLAELGQADAHPRLITRAGRVLAWVESSERTSRLALAEPGAELAFVDLPPFAGRIAARLSPDERRVVVTNSTSKTVSIIALDPCTQTEILRANKRVGDAEWLDDERLVVAADAQLFVVDPVEGILAAEPAKSAASLLVLREHGLVAQSSTDETVQLWALEGTRTTLYAQAKQANGVIADEQGVVVVGHPWRRLVRAG